MQGILRQLTEIFSIPQVWLVLVGVLNVALYALYIDGALAPRGDTKSYIAAIEWLYGSSGGVEDIFSTVRALTSPLLLYVSYQLGTLLGGHVAGMTALNIFFYIVSIPIFYRIVLRTFGRVKVAVIASLLYIFNYVLFTNGPVPLADMGGWFFMLLTTMYAIEYFFDRTSMRPYYLALASAIVGIFFKEYAALGMATFGLLLLLSSAPLWTRIREAYFASLGFIIAIAAYHVYFYLTFDFSYYDWWMYNYTQFASPESTRVMYDAVTLVKVVGWIYLIAWPVFLVAALRELLELQRFGWRRYHTVLMALIPMSFAFLIWPGFTQRVTFIMLPLVFMITALGLVRMKIPTWMLALFFGSYVWFNYHVHILIERINLPF